MNVDQKEIEKFSNLSDTWWNTDGELWTLHAINPLRLDYIAQHAELKDKKVLDVGCGGGILSESMAKLGADVTGLDLSEDALLVAKSHAQEEGIEVDYIAKSIENHAAENDGVYDVITCLEMLEHVPEPTTVVSACYKALKPGGVIFFSTLNRNIKSYFLAIIAAEYIMNMIPRGTHQYSRFIKPSELTIWCESVGFKPCDMIGIHYNPITKQFKLGKNVDVNYIITFKK